MHASISSHCAGADRVPKAVQIEIQQVIAGIDVVVGRGSAPRIRDQFITGLKSHGWSSEIPVSRDSDMTITSMKEGIGLCLQTGNMARMYADLIKLQTLYLDNAISAAVIVLPSQPLALQIGDNIAQAARLERELEIFRKAYHVPTLLIALE